MEDYEESSLRGIAEQQPMHNDPATSDPSDSDMAQSSSGLGKVMLSQSKNKTAINIGNIPQSSTEHTAMIATSTDKHQPVSLSLLDCNSNDFDPCVLKSHDDNLINCITEIRVTSNADGGEMDNVTFSSNNSVHEESHTYNQTRVTQHNEQQHKSKGSNNNNSVLKLPVAFKNIAGDSKGSKAISMKSHDEAHINYPTEFRDTSHTADFTNLTGERNVAKAKDRMHQDTICCNKLLLSSFPRETDYNNLIGIRRKQDDATSKSSYCFQAELHTDIQTKNNHRNNQKNKGSMNLDTIIDFPDNSYFCADKRDCVVALETMSLDLISSNNLNNMDLNKAVSRERQSRMTDLNLAITMDIREDIFAHGVEGFTHDDREVRSSELVSSNRLAYEGSNDLNSNQQIYGSPDSNAMETSNPTRRSLIIREKEQKEDLVRIGADCRKLFDPG